jgi:hypothetical protein
MISSVRHGSATAALNSFFDPKPLGAFFLFLRCCYDGSDPYRAGIAVIYCQLPAGLPKDEKYWLSQLQQFLQEFFEAGSNLGSRKDPEDNFVSTISIDFEFSCYSSLSVRELGARRGRGVAFSAVTPQLLSVVVNMALLARPSAVPRNIKKKYNDASRIKIIGF